ncbi:MAG TPA: hypothetical protein DDW65_00745, partial [Firmicutes bacterium]|nr:hypothetical protein [Bacillota bacterium]
MREFTPDYTNVVKAAKNITPPRIPLYEHHISEAVMEEILGVPFAHLLNEGENGKREYFRNFSRFFKEMGYDTVSMERGIAGIMPGSGALTAHKPGVIKTRADFEQYPWDEVPDLFFTSYADDFRILGEEMPAGMKAIGGPGYGIFESVQDIVSYTELCYISADDPELYADLFKTVGDVFVKIWSEFLRRYADTYCVCRFGDDLGFKSATLIPPAAIRKHIIPQHKRVIDLVHSYGKPFLLHSCGKIFDIMDDMINVAGIDAKHSNEDQIAPFSEWVDRYGDRIGNFGGIDTDHLCSKSPQEIKKIVKDVYEYSKTKGGFAIGSGNSIPNYVPAEGYLAMVEAVR